MNLESIRLKTESKRVPQRKIAAELWFCCHGAFRTVSVWQV